MERYTSRSAWVVTTIKNRPIATIASIVALALSVISIVSYFNNFLSLKNNIAFTATIFLPNILIGMGTLGILYKSFKRYKLEALKSLAIIYKDELGNLEASNDLWRLSDLENDPTAAEYLKNHKRQISECRKKAAEGDAEAQCRVTLFYEMRAPEMVDRLEDKDEADQY